MSIQERFVCTLVYCVAIIRQYARVPTVYMYRRAHVHEYVAYGARSESLVVSVFRCSFHVLVCVSVQFTYTKELAVCVCVCTMAMDHNQWQGNR